MPEPGNKHHNCLDCGFETCDQEQAHDHCRQHGWDHSFEVTSWCLDCGDKIDDCSLSNDYCRSCIPNNVGNPVPADLQTAQGIAGQMNANRFSNDKV